VADGSGEGWVTVQATIDGKVPKEQRITIGCGCAGGTCDSLAAAGGAANGSVEVRISLGKTGSGRAAGDLFLEANKPSEDLYTPEALTINSSTSEVQRLYRDDRLQQIIAPQVIVNFIRFSPQKYEIHFYDRAAKGRITKEGFADIDPMAKSIAVWRFENPDTSGQTLDGLVVTEQRNEALRKYEYRHLAGENGWSLVSNNGQKIETKTEATTEDGDRVVRREIAGADGIPVSITETVYHTFDFGEKRIREIIDPEGLRQTTAFHYHTASDPGYGRVDTRIDADGSWITYRYDDENRILRETRPFLDAAPDSPERQTRITTYGYDPVDGADSDDEADDRKPRQITETVNGIETARTYHLYSRAKDGTRTEITEQCTSPGKPYGDPTNLRMVTVRYPRRTGGPEAGKIKSRLGTDGSLTTYTYERGFFKSGANPEEARFVPGKGKARRTTVTHGTVDHPEGIPFQSTRETTITDSFGIEKLRETYVRTDTGYERIDWQFNSHNRLGQVIETLHANGTRTESEYGCCGKTSTTDVNGITTRFAYDGAKRVISSTNTATGLVTEYTRGGNHATDSAVGGWR
jgi:YD repeat-containing protein